MARLVTINNYSLNPLALPVLAWLFVLYVARDMTGISTDKGEFSMIDIALKSRDLKSKSMGSTEMK